MEEIRLIDQLEVTTLGLRRQTPMAAIKEFFADAYDVVGAAMQEQGLVPAGPPYGRYRGTPSDTVDVEAGFPVTGTPQPTGELSVGTLPAGRAVETVHVGDYESMRDTYDHVFAWIRAQGLTPSDTMWELYEAGPGSDPDPATWRTRIVWPVAGPAVTAG